MKGRRQRSDRISALPQETIEKILSHMPIRDALRTSILSKKWRYCWTRMPKLVFDDTLVNVSSDIREIKKYKLVNAIFHVLLLHTGPILELSLKIFDTKIDNEIDQIILHLSLSKNIKKFLFDCATYGYKLPLSFFSMQGLECIDLMYCKLELPLMFDGFPMLKTLYLEDVMITMNMLQQLLTNCPLLEELFVIETGQIDIITGNGCAFVDLFKCLPSIRYLGISKSYMEHLAAGGMPQRLRTSLPRLKFLDLDVCFQKQDELSSALCVINSSPNLETLFVTMVSNGKESSDTLLDLQDYSGLNLDHLKELEITSFHNYASEMEFVKLIMAKSPLLKKAQIELSESISVDEENKMLRDLLLLPFPRASPSANFIIQRPI
ncbi:hypothetical protein L2E82_13943 [Cichorium intybus]|uniref:Uncharacterized protein n=1 Tax=Cichorium intybus TaxID=13427 RepID=A0ACB9EZ29_CICIN|nr:hypothetical protein L2E82_13943 [Cichorium intybus]